MQYGKVVYQMNESANKENFIQIQVIHIMKQPHIVKD